MDDRQRQITEGAGLQESRINQDFIDWLNKWGTVILTVVLVVALAWVGWNWWQRQQTQALDTAFSDLDQAILAGSPDALLAVAAEYEGRASVPHLARLRAADTYLQAARRGVTPGGDPSLEEDLLSEEQRKQFLERARGIYSEVRDDTRGVAGKELLYFNALSGVAATLLTDRQYEQGLDLLRSLVEQARAQGYVELAAYHERRLEAVPPMIGQPDLYTINEISAAIDFVAEEPAPEVEPATEQPAAPAVTNPGPLFDEATQDPATADPGLPPTGPIEPSPDEGEGETDPPERE